MNIVDGYDPAWQFAAEAGVTNPVWLDEDGDVMSQYDQHEMSGVAYAPYPFQVLVDREGIITYMAREYDAPAIRAAIEAALE